MIRLALTSARYRLAAVIATFLAVAVGCALFTACGGIFETAIRLDAPPQRLSAAPIVVAGPTSYEFANGSGSAALPERPVLGGSDLARVAAVPGVDRAVPDVSFPAVPLRGDRPVIESGREPGAHAWVSAALTPYQLAGRAPARAAEIVLDADTARATGVGAGDRMRVAVDGSTATFAVTGVATAPADVDVPALFFADARGHRPQAIGVFPDAGVSATALAARLSDALPGLTVHTGAARGDAEFAGIAGSRLPLIILAAVFGGLVIVVMGIVVAATVSLSVRRRHRELALLRATGATPFQTRRLVLAEALTVAVLGAAAGAAAGRLVGRVLFDRLSGHSVVPSALSFHQGPIAYAAGVLVAFAGVRVAALLATRPIGRLSPVEALREAALPPITIAPIRRVAAAALAISTIALAVATMFMTPANASALGGPAVLTGAIALALVGPAAIAATADRISRLAVARRGALARLATVNLHARAVQYGAVLTPITIATAIALGNIYSQTTQDDAARAAYLDQLRADVVVTSTTGGIPAAVTDELSRLPDVTGASELATSQGWLERPFDSAHTSDPLRVLGIAAQRRTPIYAAHVDDGSLADLRPGSVALPSSLAHDLDIGLGQRVTVRLGDGARVDAQVVATLDQPSGYEQLVLPVRTVAEHTTAQLPGDLLLRTDDPAAVTAAAGRLGTNLQTGGPDVLRAEFDAGLGVQAWINYLIAALALAYAAIATINTLAVSILDRRREFGLQRLIGATRREVARMLYREVTIVGLLGYGAGAVIAVFTVWPITVASGELLPSGPLWVLAASIGVIAALLAPVTAICGRIAMRAPAGETVAATDV